MSKALKLSQVAIYSEERVNFDKVQLENFVTVDNLLPNKGGITIADNMPPQGGTLPLYRKENILVGNIRPYLRKIWFANRDGGATADVLIFVVKPNHFPKYVYYAMFRDDFFDHMMRGKKGTKMPRGDKNQILDFLIPDTKYPAQQKIAAFLSALDAKIELNNRINTELEAMAKTLYDYWFVQLDFPDKNGKPYKSSGGKMVWNEELKREIPEGWRDSSLDKYCQITRGVTYKKDEVTNSSDKDGIPILRATNISNSEIDLNDMVYVPRCLVSEEQHLNMFDLIITMSSGSKEHVGKNALFYFDSLVSYGAFCSKITVDKRALFYINIFMHSLNFKQYILNSCLGTNINNLTKEHIKSCKIINPNSSQLSAFEKLVSPNYHKIGSNIRQNLILSSLRDWLLPMLMNGQVKVN